MTNDSATATHSFLDLEGTESPGYADSSVVILPAPFERSTSYGKGTAGGPAAILAASSQVELYDDELGTEPFRAGLITLPPLEDTGGSVSRYLDALREQALTHLRNDKFVLTLGGEHTISQAPIAAASERFGEIACIQFDAHADLRDRYDGTAQSHACVMRRVAELGIPRLAIGIRSLSVAEARWIEVHREPVLWGRELADLSDAEFRRRLRDLPDRVYLTFDVDFFDPALVPATGTPEPGGGHWYPTLALLRTVFEAKTVVAMDLVELAPIADQPASDFVIARLAYKCIGYRQAFA